MKTSSVHSAFWMRCVCVLTGLVSIVLVPAGFSATDKPPDSQSATHVIVNWSVQDGLPSARINAITQTRDGYLWLATLDGLARFDGVRFERFYESGTLKLASSLITCLLEDSCGRLWFGTEDGEIGWRDDAGFHTVKSPEGRLSGQVICLVETRNGIVWAMSQESLLPIKDGVPQKKIPPLEQHYFWNICSRADGSLWVLVDGGNVYQLHPETGKMDLIIPGQLGEWRSILSARAGGLWVRDGQSIRRWQGDGWVENRGVVDLQVTESSTLRETKSGDLLVGTAGQGVWLIDAECHQQKLDTTSGLSHNQILSFYEDGEGDLWVGTVDGLNRITRRVVNLVVPPDNWKNRAVTTITLASAGTLLVGTEGVGLYRISQDSKVLAHLGDDAWLQGYIKCVLEDSRRQIWAGLFNSTLRLCDNAHPQGINLPVPTRGTVHALFQDSRKSVWMGTTKGAAMYPAGEQTPSQILLTNSDVRCLTEAGDGAVWLGTQEGGLFRYQNGAVQAVQPPDALGLGGIHALHFTADGTLTIGTWHNGLAFLNHGHWRTLTHEQGLPNDSISDLQSDAAGNLWVGSAAGIFRLEQRQLEEYVSGRIKLVNCLQLGSGDGLGVWQIFGGCQPVACRSLDGRFWYVTSAGLVVIDPTKIRPDKLAPPVVIESIQADGKPLPAPKTVLKSARGSPVAICPAGTRQLVIRYTALNFFAPRQVRFRYRLNGFDEHWMEAGDRREIYFTHLPPGNYAFEVTACNNQGVWNPTGAKATFKVLPLFWQTVWFKFLIALALLAGMIFLYRIRAARLRALERLRQQIARDLHDEVGANLGSISLLAEVMEQRPQPGDLAQIRATADQTVDTLRDLVWIINPAHEHLSDLVARLKQIAAIMLVNIAYKFAEPAQSGRIKLPLEIRRNVPPLFKEVLNNIRKHSRADRVVIRLYGFEEKLILEVVDNGVGFDASQKRPGDGLKNFQNRADEMHAELTVTSQPNKGTTVRLAAPLTKSRDWRGPLN